MEQLFEYWTKNGEKDILEKINYINFVVEPELNGKEFILLNKINVINFTETITTILKDLKIVNQIVIKDVNWIKKNINFFENKNIISIHLNKNNFTDEEFEFLLKIKTLKYLILNDMIIKSNDNLLNNQYHFKFIPENSYIDVSEMSVE